MARLVIAALLAALAGVSAVERSGTRQGTSLSANPIRRVVTMLQMMVKKVEAEGKVEQELFDKFMCWCSTGAQDLEASIEASETKIPQVEAKIKEMEALIAQLKAEIAKAKGDRAAAMKAVASLKVERKKGAAAFKKSQEDLLTNIAAMKKAIAAIEKGMGGAFLQTNTASLLRQLTMSMNNIRDSDRDALSAFLSGGEGDDTGYAPASGEIVGILKQMLDTMMGQLKEVKGTETDDITDFTAMLKAKLEIIDTLTKAIEDKLMRLGELMVEIVNVKEDLDDTGKALIEDKKFLADMDDICAKKKKEWELRCKMRAEELLALADTIKILNDDDTLELFKKTLPSASLLQVTVSSAEVRRQALAALHSSRGQVKSKDYRVSLISMALRSGKVSFDKVIKMIDDMVKLLGEEQTADDAKKKYCEAELDKTEDELKEVDHQIEDLSKAIEDTTETIATLTDEIKALEEGIVELDKSVVEATATRKEEHDDFTMELASNTAAKDILGIAKNRLNKFYNPKLYKPPPKRELTEAERITVNNGGTLAPTAAPGGIAGTGVTVLAQVEGAPPPPPETFGAYKKQGAAGGGVMAMMDELEAELDKEITEGKIEEKNAQEEYEQFVADSAEKRADDAKTMEDKIAAKAGAEVDLQKMTEEKKEKTTESMAKAEALKDLHGSCDWLLENYQTRKQARAGEADALKKAKAALSGADYSLVQRSTRRLRAKLH
jgi:peptidoglycan hydrolase CwlO-like protein